MNKEIYKKYGNNDIYFVVCFNNIQSMKIALLANTEPVKSIRYNPELHYPLNVLAGGQIHSYNMGRSENYGVMIKLISISSNYATYIAAVKNSIRGVFYE